MKIAIKANPSRGKEIISLLESLGGINSTLEGNGEFYTYYIDEHNVIRYHDAPTDYKVYTLEEFEKELPFKIGDKVITNMGHIGVIEKLSLGSVSTYYVKTNDTNYWCTSSALRLYKEMKEERNITLTLEKAKEWYNKGGELREIALQAFSEKELNPLPKSWEEYCRKYEYTCLSTRYTNIPLKYDALLKLEQLRDCYRGIFVTVIGMPVWNISMYDGKPHIFQAVWGKNQSFLSFQSRKVAEEYLENFEPLIEKAGDLIS